LRKGAQGSQRVATNARDRQIGYPSTTGSRSKRNGTEFSMNAFVVSLAMGSIVGIVYGLSGVRSPAPPIIALVGLLGMVLGEDAREGAFFGACAGSERPSG
jgi:XapX domain-containing protein